MNNLVRIELILVGLLLAVVAGIAVVVGLVRPRPVPVVAEVQPLRTSVSRTTDPTVAATIAPTITLTAAPTTPPTTTATVVPTVAPTIVPTPLPSAAASPLPTPDMARQAGVSVWWLGGGAVLFMLAPVAVYLRRRHTCQQPVPALTIVSSPVASSLPLRASPTVRHTPQLPLPCAAQDPTISEYADAGRPNVPALPPLLDERPVLPTLELGVSLELSAPRTLLSRSLLDDRPDEIAALATSAGDLTSEVAESQGGPPPLPVALAAVIRRALVATGTRSLWLGLQWRGHSATALFAFADDPDATPIALAERIAAETGGRCRWTAHGLQISLPRTLDLAPRPWPLLVPVLTVERGATWALVLDRWRHLALYGAQAVGVTYQILTQLLTEHAPTELAVALIDPQRLLGALYGVAPHRLTIDQPPALLLGQCLYALRQGHGATERPLLLVVVEPDDATISALLLLLPWLQAASQAPLHLVVVAAGVRPTGRDLYALLPGVITAGGSGDARLLPGAPEHWPKAGSAQVISRAGRWSGQPLLLDEATVAATIAQLPMCAITALAPTLWHAGAGAPPVGVAADSSRPAPAESVLPNSMPSDHAPAVSTANAAAHRGDALAISVDPAVEDRGVTRLTALIDGVAEVPRAAVATSPPEAEPNAADAAWPTDLAPEVRPGDLRVLWTTIVDDGGYHPSLRGGNGAKAGLTLRRLRGLAPDRLQGALPRLLVWFDRARLLHAPAREDVPFGMPRLPVSTDLTWIAQQLVAISPPAADDPLVLALGRKRGGTT